MSATRRPLLGRQRMAPGLQPTWRNGAKVCWAQTQTAPDASSVVPGFNVPSYSGWLVVASQGIVWPIETRTPTASPPSSPSRTGAT